MANDFKKFDIYLEVSKHLFRSEVEYMINQTANEKGLLLPDGFSREHYTVYHQVQPFKMEIDYRIVFYAREKTHDDILREQIEFQIKELEK